MRISPIHINLQGHDLLLRVAGAEDAGMLLEYLRDVSRETSFLAKEPDEIGMTVEEEQAYIDRQNASERNLMLLGFWDGEFVGNCALIGMDLLRYRHRASVAIALYQKYTGRGIGKAMLDQLIAIAGDRGYEQLELEVAAENRAAIALYEKMGFVQYGTMPNYMKYRDGTYADVHWMMRRLQTTVCKGEDNAVFNHE